MKKIIWHSQPTTDCLEQLHTSLCGLSQPEASKRLEAYGQNKIPIRKRKTFWKKWINQFHNVLIYILFLAAIITGLLQYWVDTSVIVAVILLNALIGYIQEGKAEKAIDALKKMLSLQAIVLRDGNRTKITANELVPGDIVFLHVGNKVPADLRILKSSALQIDESLLTGESLPVEKDSDPVNEKSQLMNRKSMAYSGTLVTYGMGVGVVVSTGKNTEVGRISAMLTGLPKLSTPLLDQITVFGRWVAMAIVSVSLIIFLFGIFVRQYPIEEMLLAAVAVAVAIIPEGLPAIITITLAIGVIRMARRHAIVRRLASVETLSSVTVICTDKTGTLTKNELTVRKIITANDQYNVLGSGYNDDGKLIQNGKSADIEKNQDLFTLLRSAILCNEAELKKTNQQWHLIGNPMDGALLALGLKANLTSENLIKNYPRTDFIPFDSQHKLMASLHHDHEGNAFIFIKGAPEKILLLCGYQSQNQKNKMLDKQYWSSEVNQLAKNGMRVLAFAFRKIPKEQTMLSFKDLEKDFVFLGIVGIIDPPREEAHKAILKCQQAGIQIKMVTGDHSLTAQAIGKQVGIINDRVLSGENIDVMSDDQLSNVIEYIDIFARTTPAHKLRIVNALRKHNAVIAMTGDGVNDAPALKNADMGIAMGIKGTDVAKEAAEIVLADDNFASIEHAIEESRNIYNNIKKAILFVLPSSGAEGLLIFLSILLGYTLPITPLQILWVNMVTAVTLGLALAFEPPEKNLMQQKPRDSKEPLLSKLLLWRISFVSALFVTCIFGLFLYETNKGASIILSRTMVVDLLVVLEVVYLMNCRRIYYSVITKESILSGKPAFIAIGIVILLQIGFTYLPFMQYIFHAQPLNLSQWMTIIFVAIFIFFIVELEKLMFRNFLM